MAFEDGWNGLVVDTWTGLVGLEELVYADVRLFVFLQTGGL